MGEILRVKTRADLIQRLPQWGVGCEVGVLNGVFAEQLLRVAQPQTLFLIDHWLWTLRWQVHDGGQWREETVIGEDAYRQVRTRFAGEIIGGRVRILHGPSKVWLSLFPDRYLDWAYIDADHSYEACLTDLELAWPKVKRGGWILGHDYCDLFGVPRAVEEFCQRHGLQVNILTDEEPMPVVGTDQLVSYNSFAIWLG